MPYLPTAVDIASFCDPQEQDLGGRNPGLNIPHGQANSTTYTTRSGVDVTIGLGGDGTICASVELLAQEHPEYVFTLSHDWRQTQEDRRIQAAFPRLYAHIAAWRAKSTMGWDDTGRMARLGGEAPAPTPPSEASWWLEGFQLACQLALQNQVTEVHYWTPVREYRLEKRTVNREFGLFLDEMETGEGGGLTDSSHDRECNVDVPYPPTRR